MKNSTMLTLKTGRSFLCICLVYGFLGTSAVSYAHDKNSFSSHNGYAIMTGGRNNPCLFDRDTLPGTLTSKKSGPWEVLFDGKNTDQWKGVNSDSFPPEGWEIADGTLSIKNHVRGEDIITREEYSNFELVFDFKLTNAANSGLKYFVNKIKNNANGHMTWNGPEYQIIDDYNNIYVKDNQHAIGSTASLYLIYAPKNKKLLPAGQWNHVKIVANGKHVEHWLNGVKVVSYEKGTKDFRARVSETKFKDYTHYGEASSGHIMLTDHDGDKVYFRNMKIRRLN